MCLSVRLRLFIFFSIFPFYFFANNDQYIIAIDMPFKNKGISIYSSRGYIKLKRFLQECIHSRNIILKSKYGCKARCLSPDKLHVDNLRNMMLYLAVIDEHLNPDITKNALVKKIEKSVEYVLDKLRYHIKEENKKEVTNFNFGIKPGAHLFRRKGESKKLYVVSDLHIYKNPEKYFIKKLVGMIEARLFCKGINFYKFNWAPIIPLAIVESYKQTIDSINGFHDLAHSLGSIKPPNRKIKDVEVNSQDFYVNRISLFQFKKEEQDNRGLVKLIDFSVR